METACCVCSYVLHVSFAIGPQVFCLQCILCTCSICNLTLDRLRPSLLSLENLKRSSRSTIMMPATVNSEVDMVAQRLDGSTSISPALQLTVSGDVHIGTTDGDNSAEGKEKKVEPENKRLRTPPRVPSILSADAEADSIRRQPRPISPFRMV